MRNLIRPSLLICWLFVFSVLARGQTEGITPEKIFYLTDIRIEGLERTSVAVVKSELDLPLNESLQRRQIEAAVQNIKNTRLFSSVEYRIESLVVEGGSKNQKKNVLVVSLAERWTAIPVFKLQSGGGVSQITAGVYDSNLFGEFLEAGIQAEKLEEVYSGVLWFKNPRLFNKKIEWALQYWNVNRIRIKYNQDEDQAIPILGFLHQREKIFSSLILKAPHQLRYSILFEYNRDEFSDDFLEPKIKQLLTTKPLPKDTEVLMLGVGVSLGEINYGRHQEEGLVASLDYRYATALTQGVSDFQQVDLGIEWKKRLGYRGTFAQRLLSGNTTTKILQYWHYLGGLDRIRGFSNDRFAGRYYWLNNSEFRWVVIDQPKYIVQGVGFLDLIGTGEEFRGLGTLAGASVGGGARVIFPKIYRFVARFDFASPIRRDDDMNFSFGVQQFF